MVIFTDRFHRTFMPSQQFSEMLQMSYSPRWRWNLPELAICSVLVDYPRQPLVARVEERVDHTHECVTLQLQVFVVNECAEVERIELKLIADCGEPCGREREGEREDRERGREGRRKGGEKNSVHKIF